MQLVTIKGYTFDELSTSAKDRVRYWVNEDMDLFNEDDREYWEEELGELGYTDCDFRYSGFGSQGDGASIACTVAVAPFLERKKLVAEHARLVGWLKRVYGAEWRTAATVTIERATYPHYVHEYMLHANTEALERDLEDWIDTEYEGSRNYLIEPVCSLAEAVGELILEEVRKKSRELYQWLEADYDSRFEDEYVADMCDANNWIFDESGDFIAFRDREVA